MTHPPPAPRTAGASPSASPSADTAPDDAMPSDSGPRAAITIRLDDRVLQLPAGTRLSELLAHEALPPAGVATALNGRFIPRAARAATTLSDGDQVILFQPIVGG